ncbi:TPA: DUF1828 domain-containing protein [Klebsiella pneumoniae]|nr:DUF1828 domain-containing protein [Klebsiella pneumoniae]HBT4679577.1 DUF1828 domain-containing protein [Klebsiella pneumoniae]
MMCSTIISRLGYECLPIGEESLRIISPFPYCDDGEHVGAFVQQINGIYKVTDRCDALMNMEARGISLNQSRLDSLRQLLSREGAELNERGEILKWAQNENELGKVTSDVIRAGILASAMSIDWYSPIQSKRFEADVIDFLSKSSLSSLIVLREEVSGMSGHNIVVPVTIKTATPKYIFTSSIKEGGSWNSAYSLLGKLMDLYQANNTINNRYVVVDDESIGHQMQQLILLFNDVSNVLPFVSRSVWLPKLAA